MCTDAIRRALGAQIGVVQAMATEATVRNALAAAAAAAAAAAVLAANGIALQQQHHHYLTLELSSTTIRRRNIMSLLQSIHCVSSECRYMMLCTSAALQQLVWQSARGVAIAFSIYESTTGNTLS
jgi:hypothetical protein